MSDPSPLTAQVAGRAFVVPGTAANMRDNVNNMSADGAAKTTMLLEITSTADGRPGVAGSHTYVDHVPNWIRIVLYYSGTNDGPSEHLPAQVQLPVLIDPTTRAIQTVDWDQAAIELAASRDVAVKFWKDGEAALAPLRSATRLPGAAIKGGKGLLREWRDAVKGLKDDLKADSDAAKTGTRPPLKGPAWNDKEVEQARRTAVTQRYYFEKRPEERAKLRATTLANAPSQVAQVRAGLRHPLDFEHWLMVQETSGILTTDEVADLRRQAAAAPEQG